MSVARAAQLPIADLLPHNLPMLLLERLLEAGDDFLTCEVVVRSDGLFDTAGRVPAFLGLEYMAQAVSAFSGFHAINRGRAVRLGFLLGTQKFSTNVSAIDCGEVLRVNARCVMQSKDGMGSFDCTVVGESIEQSARISVYEPVDSADYLERGRGNR